MKRHLSYIVLLLVLLSACSKMDDSYKQFIANGEIPYAGAVDSVKVFPGKNRLQLSWLLTDPQVTRAKIYWNNKSDSLEVTTKRMYEVDTVNVILSPLAEGPYTFDIYTFDDKGNKSIRVSTTGQVYGDRYISSLLPRPVKSAIYANGKVSITWGSADTRVTATQIRYTNTGGSEQRVTVPVDSVTTTLSNFAFSPTAAFDYTTEYKPDTSAIDLFYSAYETVAVKGPPKEYVKSGWTATATDFDEPSGRGPAFSIDDNPTTAWLMSKISGVTYPHTITVDMGAMNLVYGITFIQRTPLDGPLKLVEIEMSNDKTTWEPLGAYTLAAVADKQYIDLSNAVSFRYFRVIARSDYKNGGTSALAEVGVYKR
ncbi:MAG TPA: DUF4998 domain-containing protein [Chitinophaga sp.]|uniref:DUF4998 domain-containing protein n=1 Tax=Chitinophaga sp. TaxID=1869181 RepID=UPI002D163BA0|nr:DUF4998 domain-containing protein [Chitinophaga sp.]HVI45148.1 DUF4998 domain-containing protein [Chitinophaga sp.]